jgi:hypothetical protein
VCTEKRFIPFTTLHFLPYFVSHTEFKKALNMPRRMYSIIHLSEIMRLSAFPSTLIYPSS